MLVNKKCLALFDFDGTITKGDSFLRFIIYAIPGWDVLVGAFRLLPHLIAYIIGGLSNREVKEKVFRVYFAGWKLTDIETTSIQFALEILPQMVKKDILSRMLWHRDNHHRIIIVSASFEFYLRPFCEEMAVELLGTQIKVCNEVVTGEFFSPNCYGAEKVSRISSCVDISEYYIYAYGNSRGDHEMLEIANEPYFVKNNRMIRYSKPMLEIKRA